MVARNQIHCTVVAVPVVVDRWGARGAMAKDLLPWADPYVAQLIRNLQDEVRQEREEQSLVRHYRAAGDGAAVASTSRRISAVK
jgi:hypothetical protein